MGEIELRLCSERERLAGFDDPRALLASARSGYCRLIAGDYRRATELPHNPVGAIGGPCRPDWCTPDQYIMFSDVLLFKQSGGWLLPKLGVVIAADGAVMESSWREASFILGGLGQLPFATETPSGAQFVPPAGIERLGAVVVTLPWGGLSNYGHFVIDCGAAVALCRQTGIPARYRHVFPPLSHWQERHLQLFGVEDWDVLTAEAYFADEILWTSCIDHFLHWPNENLNRLADLQIDNLRTPDSQGASRIYISRRGDTKRAFAAEAALETALERRGFAVVQPQSLAVDEQVALFRNARVVAGCTGAGFANCIYCRPGAALIEIQPTPLQGIWVRNIAALRRATWHPYFCTAAAAPAPVVVGGNTRPELGIAIDLDIPDFLAFLDGVGV